MGRQFVRQTVAAFFAPPAVVNLNTVYTAAPRRVMGQEYFAGAAAGTPSSAVAFPYVSDMERRRIALGGAHSGWKMVGYTVDLQVFFASNQLSAQAAEDDHDALIDAIVTRLESDRQLGTVVGAAPYIFQAGEGDPVTGGPDIHVMTDLPRKDQQMLLIWSVVRFRAMEAVQT